MRALFSFLVILANSIMFAWAASMGWWPSAAVHGATMLTVFIIAWHDADVIA